LKAAGSAEGQSTPPCQCGGHKPTTLSEGADMDKKARIAALVANPHNAVKDIKVLEAFSDDALKALEDAAAAATKTADDLRAAQETLVTTNATLKALQEKKPTLADMPAEIQTLVTEATALRAAQKAKDDARKGELVTALTACQQVFDEASLNAMDVPALEKLAALAAPKTVDYSVGASLAPRAAAGFDAKSYAAPDPYATAKK
jgi:hypothetical protein